MSDERYKLIGPLDIRMMEELAETIHAITKALRFGWDDWHPEHPGQNNRALIHAEMQDVVDTWNEVARREGLPSLEWKCSR